MEQLAHLPELPESFSSEEKDSDDPRDDVTFFREAARAVRAILSMDRAREELEEAQEVFDSTEIMRQITEQQTELDQVRMEKELYVNQVLCLEQYFRKIDELSAAVERRKKARQAERLKAQQEKAAQLSVSPRPSQPNTARSPRGADRSPRSSQEKPKEK